MGHTQELFVSLLASNQRRIFAYIMSLVLNINDADDIFQETVKMMWEKFDQFEPGTDFLAWSVTIAHYRILDFRKKKNRAKVLFDDALLNSIQSQAITQLEDTDDYIYHLKSCLQKLSRPDLMLIKMRYMQNLTVKEIASRVGRNLKSVYRSIARIQSTLRKCIKYQPLSGGLNE